MEKKPFNYQNTDELDPVILVEKAILFLRNSRNVLLLFALLGLLLGISRFLLSPKIYKSRALLHSIVLTNQEEIEMIDSWNQLLGKGEYQALARLTQAEIPSLKKLKKIERMFGAVHL